eukprot:TRINITY_DN11801_c0_g8_i2.p1 TRINITY_DN11801_c0_g8~~TRINITY_DN11801_c0_g8_i2.p1  ORF type:complete len:204 (-),score=45.23 TRINITY_DN11801_c0_g8_i2:13-624(-)
MIAVASQKLRAGFAWLPCVTCTEYHAGKPYQDLMDDRAHFLQLPAALSPQLPVVFDADADGEDALPPVYRPITGKWQLAQGVGPKSLEVRKDLPMVLPASQFRVLLPGSVAPPPPCRGASAGGAPRGNAGRGSGGKRAGLAEAAVAPDEIQGFLDELWTTVPDYESLLTPLLPLSIEARGHVSVPLFSDAEKLAGLRDRMLAG